MNYYLIDIGNSDIKIFKKKNDSYEKYTFKNTRNVDLNNPLDKVGFSKDDFVVLSSVSLDTKEILLNYFKSKNIKTYDFSTSVFENHISFKNVTLEEMGADRLVDILGVADSKVIIVDLGTALTVDVINNDIYETGFIFPGLRLQLNSLIQSTDINDDFEFKNFLDDFNFLTTTDQLNSSLILGIIGTINQYLFFIADKVDINDYKIFLTGGGIDLLNRILGDKFKELIKYDYKIISDLNYKGLNKILLDLKKKEVIDES